MLISAVTIGLLAGMPAGMITDSVTKGIGKTLEGIALLVGLGSMFGAILEISGGSERIALSMIRKFGENKAAWALGLTGMIIATLAAMLILGLRHGYSMKELEVVMTDSLKPTGMILLVTAGGGVLRYMLQDSGLGDIIGNAVAASPLPLVVVAFLIAGAVRISIGSATVAMTMAVGIMAAMPAVAGQSQMYLAAIVMAIAGGATIMSHVNDSGFWLVKSLLQIDEKTTFKIWTMMETIVGLTGFAGALIVSMFC